MKLIIILFVAFQLMSCGGAVDNAEPPAKLVEFTRTAMLTVEKEIDYQGTASLFSRIEPFEVGDKVVFADSQGLVSVFNKEGFNASWQKSFQGIQPAAIGGNNSVYLIGTRGGEVLALDASSGELKWKVRVSSEVLARPAISKDVAVVKTVDGQLTALDLKTGQEKWIFKKEIPLLSVRGNSTPLIIDEKIITGLDSGKLVIVDLLTGALFWEKTITIPHGRSEIQRLVDLDANIVINNNVIYIAGYQGRVVALDLKTGDFLWIRKMSVVSDMAFEDNRLYLTDVRSHIWALDTTTGATVWKQEVFTARKLTSPVIMNDFLLLADFEGYLHVIAKSDGHQVARTQIDPVGIDISPIVVNSDVYLLSRDSKIYLVKLKKQAN